MDDIRRQFQKTSTEYLKKKSAELEQAETVSIEDQQEIFRRIHTIKGSAQTFGLPNSSDLAHDLENVLVLLRGNGENQKEQLDLLAEGFRFLILSIEYPDFTIPESFIKKIRKDVSRKPLSLAPDILLTLIPPEVFEHLTEFEKTKLRKISDEGKSIIGIDAIFTAQNFADELPKLQEVLNRHGEIAFTLPGEKELSEDEIGFQIFLAGDADSKVIQDAIKDFNAEVNVVTSNAEYSNDLSGVLSKIVSQGKIWAGGLEKKVRFKVISDEPNLNADYLGLIFEIILHLVRNAVDHSFNKEGTVEILLKETDGGIDLSVSDDGNGIDLFVIRAKAIEQKLILPDTNLSEQETLDLIFMPGFSTAEKVTELSGRGVGLDTVQNLVIGSKGTIQVESQTGKGTTFDIFLPLD